MTSTDTHPQICPGSHCKWGRVDDVNEYAPGITFVSTSSHGGVLLSPERNAAVHPAWRRADGAYEEDADWAIPCFTFPWVFPERIKAHMHDTLRNWHPKAYMEITGDRVDPSQSYMLRKQQFEAAAADQLVVYSAVTINGSEPRMVACWARRGKDGPESRHHVPAAVYQAGGEFGFILDPALYPPIAPAPRAAGAAAPSTAVAAPAPTTALSTGA